MALVTMVVATVSNDSGILISCSPGWRNGRRGGLKHR